MNNENIESQQDFIVHVDRSIKPSYPRFFMELIHPELECAGPAEYNLKTDVEQWLNNDQKHGYFVQGTTIYWQLRKYNILSSCLNLQDGLAIQRKGIEVFRKLFMHNSSLFLWGSFIWDSSRGRAIPFLCEKDGQVVLDWEWLETEWKYKHPALHFRKNV